MQKYHRKVGDSINKYIKKYKRATKNKKTQIDSTETKSDHRKITSASLRWNIK